MRPTSYSSSEASQILLQTVYSAGIPLGLSATLAFDESSPEAYTFALLDSCRVFQAVFTGPGAVFWSRMEMAANRRSGESLI